MFSPRLQAVTCSSPAGLHRVAYHEWGAPDNPDVVLCVHGLTRTGRDFDDLAMHLAKDFRVVCPDVVGRGLSDRLANPMFYAVPQYVIDAPGGGGKVPINPDYVLSRNRNRVIIRNFEGRVFEYPEDANGTPLTTPPREIIEPELV